MHRPIQQKVWEPLGPLLKQGRRCPLLYFEVLSGTQTQHFHPTHYVDISSVESTKRAACFAHASQVPSAFYGLHEAMQKFRGVESGLPMAEAFIRHVKSPTQLDHF